MRDGDGHLIQSLPKAPTQHPGGHGPGQRDRACGPEDTSVRHSSTWGRSKLALIRKEQRNSQKVFTSLTHVPGADEDGDHVRLVLVGMFVLHQLQQLAEGFPLLLHRHLLLKDGGQGGSWRVHHVTLALAKMKSFLWLLSFSFSKTIPSLFWTRWDLMSWRTEAEEPGQRHKSQEQPWWRSVQADVSRHRSHQSGWMMDAEENVLRMLALLTSVVGEGGPVLLAVLHLLHHHQSSSLHVHRQCVLLTFSYLCKLRQVNIQFNLEMSRKAELICSNSEHVMIF